MPSTYGAAFNHDPWADGYDAEVQKEQNPIRAGYAEVLAWTVARAQIGPNDVVIDLGSGTGNTTALIGPAAQIICVDLSARMAELARPKLAHRPEVVYVQADLLGFFDAQAPMCNALVSTYAVHHLTEPEKGELFHHIAAGLRPDGRAVFGDLMGSNLAELARLADYYRSIGDAETVEGLEEEFFWSVDVSQAQLRTAGLEVLEVRRFSTLSWGIATRKPV